MAEEKFEENLIEELKDEAEENLEAESVEELADEIVENLETEPVEETADEAIDNLEAETAEEPVDETVENLDAESVEEAADEAIDSLEAKPAEDFTEAPASKTSMGKNIFFSILRIVLVAALVCAVVYYVFLRNTASDAPASQVFAAVSESVKTDKMEKSTNRFFKKYYGLNAADFDDVLFYAPISNMDAEELLVVKLKDPAQAEAVSDAILKRQADKEQSFEGYAPEQYALTQKYILDVKGNYVLFVIDPNAEAIDSAFANSL